MFKFIKQNWIIAVISGAVGSIITLFAIFALHVKAWDSDAWGVFFNFFVAIGTIGAVVTSLYLSNISKKKSLVMARKQALYLGFEVIDMMSKYDFILKEHISGNTAKEHEISKKLNDFQWHISFNFNENEVNNISSYIFKHHNEVLNFSLYAIQSVSGSKDNDFYRIYFKYIKDNSELETILIAKLTIVFQEKNQENYFNFTKKEYFEMCNKVTA